uniref:EF-hand domain-containing protein n=1 Tax=Anopheles stephensi TaxID=30069 RepID=A0A182XYL6_ANOST
MVCLFLQKAFNSFDREKTGSISSDMVAEILRLMGQPFNSKILEEMIEEVDEDKSGQIEFAEFVTLAAKFIVEEDEEALQKELREAFRLYDKEGNGFIPTTCLREILRELDDQLTDEDLDMMIEEIDSDGSGTVDFDVPSIVTRCYCYHSQEYAEREIPIPNFIQMYLWR